MAFNLNEVVPWGRSLDEYQRMFALSDEDLAGRSLGCGDGPASFNAEATAKGHAVVSCDPIYAISPGEIEQRVVGCYDNMITQARNNLDEFVWDYFHDPDHLGQCRLAAMRRFLADFDQGKVEGRYVTASLPHLPFVDSQFNLALVSHLLFLYSDQLDFDFHRAAIEELLRVARKVRIFPLLALDRRSSPHVEPICAYLAKADGGRLPGFEVGKPIYVGVETLTDFINCRFHRSSPGVWGASYSVISRLTRHGFPTANTPLGMSLVTTLPAPMTVLEPILTPGQMIAPPPTHTSDPISIGLPNSCFRRSSAFIGWVAV